MPTYTNTVRHALRRLTGTNVISDIDAGIAALADDIDAIMASADAGTLASRPVSTAGTPGILGRFYRVTDQANRVDFDYGFGWITVAALTDGVLYVAGGLQARPFNGALDAAAIALLRAGETQYRFYVRGDGLLYWGSGTAAPDTYLYRSAVNALQASGALDVAGALTKGGTAVALTNDARLTDQRAPKGPETNLKIIRGNVTSAGAVENGSGFTVVRNSLGRYTLTFSTAFASAPSVALTLITTSGEIIRLDWVPLVGSAGVTVTMAGAYADAAFSFIAIGPA